MIAYAGIGSRRISLEEGAAIVGLAKELSRKFVLYSGHADGSDQKFEEGAGGESVIWLPYPDFFKEVPVVGKAVVKGDSLEGMQTTRRFHPRYHMLGKGAHPMMNRNHHQVLGFPPEYPRVSFLVCCANPGCDDVTRTFLAKFGDKAEAMVANHVEGGTGQAVRIASYFGIPVFNIRTEGWRDALEKFVATLG